MHLCILEPIKGKKDNLEQKNGFVSYFILFIIQQLTLQLFKYSLMKLITSVHQSSVRKELLIVPPSATMQVSFCTAFLLFDHNKYDFMAKLGAIMIQQQTKTLRFVDSLLIFFLTGPVMAALLAIKKRQGKVTFKMYRRKKFQPLSFRNIRKIITEYLKLILLCPYEICH